MRKVILDTDLGPDCDDCGALAILDQYHRNGKAELLGVVHCTSDRNSLNVIASVNEWFGVKVPIGQIERDDFFNDEQFLTYTKPLSDGYLKSHAHAPHELAVPLMRRLLAEHRDVTLVYIGFLSNLRDLLVSEADDLSPLNGLELVEQSVTEVISMGGHFAPPFNGEFNINGDIIAAQYVTEHCPVPITFCGFEAGENVITGATLADCDDAYPVKEAYRLYCRGSFLRPSWDLVTVYYALEPHLPQWNLSEECKIRFDDQAKSILSPGSGARFVRYADESELADTLNKLIMPPAATGC